MRRMVKENLVRFDGRPLFPERRSHTVAYELSEEERNLYEALTAYVREEMNRAERLDENRHVNVGFALQSLQRRLASSPEAIYRSLMRRWERLEARLRDEAAAPMPSRARRDWDDYDNLDEQEATELEQTVLDRATSAQTTHELRPEISTLVGLERRRCG